jgi:hypothetical protein
MAWGVDHRAKWLAPILDTPDQGGGGADSEGFYGNVQVEIGNNNDILSGECTVQAFTWDYACSMQAFRLMDCR